MDILNLYVIASCSIISAILAYQRIKSRNISFFIYLLYLIYLGIFPFLKIIFDIHTYNTAGLSYDVDQIAISKQLLANFLNIVMLVFFWVGEKLLLNNQKECNNIIIIDNRNQDSEYLSFLLYATIPIIVLGFYSFLSVRGISTVSDYHTLFSSQMRSTLRLKGSWALGVFSALSISLLMLVNYLALLKKNKLLIAFFFIATLLTMTIMGGTRSYMMYVLGPIIYYYIKNKEINKLRIVGIFCIFLLMPIVADLVRDWRLQSRRDIASLIKVAEDSGSVNSFMSNSLSEMNLYQFFLYNAVDKFPDRYDWLYGNTYKNMLLFWLPSRFYKYKIDTIFYFADAMMGTNGYAEENRVSMHPTFTGDSYINFGYLLWIPAILWGMIFSYFYINSPKNPLLDIFWGSTSGMFIMYLFRGSIYYGFSLLVFNIAYLLLLNKIYFLLHARKRLIWWKRPLPKGPALPNKIFPRDLSPNNFFHK